MRSAPGAVTSFLAANNVAFRADLITVTLLDGTIYRWTTWERDLTVSGNTFLAASSSSPYILRGPFSQSGRLVVDVLDLTLSGPVPFGMGVAGNPVQAAVAGWYDGARVKVDHLIMPSPGDVSLGPIPAWFEGRVAGLDPVGVSVTLHVKSELNALNVALPKFLLQPGCGNAVYDTNCKVDRPTFTIAGTASGSPTASSVPTTTAGIIAKATGYFNLGVLKFTSGALAGARRSVAASVLATGTTTFTLALPFAAAPSAGDGFSVYPGCDRSKGSCHDKFNNLPRYRGYPHIPSPEAGG